MDDRLPRKFSYWFCPGKRKGCNNIRARTRKEANILRHSSDQWHPFKVTVRYNNILDLIEMLTDEDYVHSWEESAK